MFLKVVELEKDRSEQKWTFKSLQKVVILLHKLKREKEMVEKYEELLTHMNNVTRNDCTSGILNYLSFFLILCILICNY